VELKNGEEENMGSHNPCPGATIGWIYVVHRTLHTKSTFLQAKSSQCVASVRAKAIRPQKNLAASAKNPLNPVEYFQATWEKELDTASNNKVWMNGNDFTR
jgi:5-methylcytosine-specific restriction endonuclease McrBC GTP-binding regulatory subunit McrB